MENSPIIPRALEPMFCLSVEEARALYRELEKQYINHENEIALKVVYSLGKFIDANGKQ